MNERNMQHPGLVINPLFARALGMEEVMLVAFPYRAGMRPAADRSKKTPPQAAAADPRRN